MTPEERLVELGHQLPAANPAVGSYVGAVTVGNIVFVSGHGPYRDGEYVYTGKLGREVDVATGQAAPGPDDREPARQPEGGDRRARPREARRQAARAGQLDPEFGEQPKVANGASDLLVEVFGPERGPHARSAIGMGALPFAIPVEIEGIFEID